ncbi:MAG: bifunctional riboflavin kinase/FAD synthetase [Clostridia bacterium]|nr:bifunctional riboflavin kinase/FAD synthetase [Clostridia bacterium]
MEVRRGFSQREKYKDVILTIGFYDGIHKGHQEIIRYVTDQAKRRKGKSCIITFPSHPCGFFSGRPLSLITTWEEKEEILAQTGIDLVVLLDFTSRLASLSPHSFIEKIRQVLEIREMVVGEDFVFGNKREGDVRWLRENEKVFEYKLKVIPCLKVGQEKVSSSLIRDWLKEGEVKKTTLWLGRYPTILGKVIKGKRRGRNLGYPTANLEPCPQKLLPGPGVYAGKVMVGGNYYKGIVNVGSKPTFKDMSFGVEAHILRFQDDIYGEEIKIELVARLREIEQFSSSLDLAKRLEEDKREAEKILE